MNDINQIIYLVKNSEEQKQKLFDLIFNEDDKTGYHAAWIFTHFSKEENSWLFDKQDRLIEEVLKCKHAGKRRIILQLLFKQAPADPPRIDFLDFCLERMISPAELPGVQSLCMKLAYEMCRTIPELLQEFEAIIDMIDYHKASPAIQSVRRNILKALPKRKSLQKY